MKKIEKRKELPELEKIAIKFRESSISPSTLNAYRSDWRAFVDFCMYHELEALPATEKTICLYISHLAENHAVSSIVRALSSINKAHGMAGHGTVRTPEVLATLEGIKRQCGGPAKQMKGIRYSQICKMARLCEGTLLGTRDRAILMIGWTSALRRSELVALNIGDVEFEERGALLTIRRSKTDQIGKGRHIAILRSSDTEVCPVRALVKWIARLPEKERTSDKPLFRGVGTSGRRTWCYMVDVKGRLTPRMVSHTVKRYARLLNLPIDKYASHSLRRGLATEAGGKGVPERIIARHTGHNSMEVLRDYIESGAIWTENPLSAVYPTTIASSAE